MGASGWDYFTPFHDDPADALAELREEIFESDDYLRPAVVPDEFVFESIEDVVAAAMEDGTHSILDINAIAGEPLRSSKAVIEFGEAAVVSDELLIDIFGTATPDKATVLDEAYPLLDLCQTRWTAICVPVFEDGEPIEYFFAGFSGD